ncbi:uncharacterized protein AMSG_02162 [Thecamonas trahens ATCC 50062]|uniref:Uncharacterized protein n=1 Tax=Thecamonas trahens ATCC 50062 TaxID=461836 RepID=A0A0L0DVP3_THETB|nr:hypothetical protein AMSG_02162 [Thecamonas trahens ATCC 50062]KNC56146.1 hypothetical protein AMSG_02162 [Thecamonas trahens ATCC 50062]|eukprot:XP_013761183.1 hypothetical protein AMSG_02162 [Thecamonas trahens ATCC 50062]
MAITLSVLETEIENRIQTGNLYSLAECKGILASLLKQIAEEAQRDFRQLLLLDERQPKLQPGEEPISTMASSSAAALASIFDIQTAMEYTGADARQRLHALKSDVHLSILKIIHIAQEQAKERLKLIHRMIGSIPPSDASPDAGNRSARRSKSNKQVMF